MKWLIVAGGTGGHIIPGVAVAQQLLKLQREVYFISGTRKVEETILKNKPFKVYKLDVEGFVGRSFKNKIKAFIKMVKAIAKAYKIVNDLNPHIILATGGYISFPLVLVGKIKGKKLGLHEQNIEPGIANKVLSYMVDKIFVSMEESKNYFPKEKVVFSGNPVREDILNLKPREHSGKGLLILGGSLGARFINELAIKFVPLLLDEFEDLLIIHQTGLDDFERINNEYKKLIKKEHETRLKVFPFIEDMSWAYSQVDLFLGRCGATTLAELFAVGLPAIFIPFPYATRNHQEKNAKIVAQKDGAILIRQKEATPEVVLKEIKDLLKNEEKLKSMSQIMKSFYTPAPQKIIINELEELIKNG
ncbi:MAG: UDP-N-acetylglucosamine:LPS N-acetylglucosamine transferase [Thermodesulfobacterium sp.]|uniref:UDP-N-acetylglucosamine--N-acetylmuramyl-(pentapeptide) pyrophosphoryl-undecaprenol N-acetylglucosamine transferase n=1 Tax=Candidatus Thermodesulfobacterium syntrophicum TaxID=3060442 RepID=A0AAE3TF54_9BACT|nr:UDP-N-acetylglucosamine:LPS N-acetylglucosamine transferase [Candidatus Thermodesulfobacterium syntrophicum]